MKPDGDATRGAPTAGDPYVPDSGNGGYRVTHYDLALTYRPEANRLEGTATITATATQKLSRFSLDLAGLKVTKVLIDGRRIEKFAIRGRKLLITIGRTIAADASFGVTISYGGNPEPLDGPWGDIGWEELTEGVIVASQPNGAPSWFPCNDHPSNKATYRIAMTVDSPFRVIITGTLVEQKVRSSVTQWVYEQPAPMATYLASVQIGSYDVVPLAAAPVPQLAARPQRLKKDTDACFERQADMLTCFTELFGPYPFADYTVVITDDDLEIPLEAQGMSIFGANHLDGTHERLVAHELAHQWFGNSLTVAAWKDIWLNEGFACYAEWLWSEHSGAATADEHATKYWQRLSAKPADLLLIDPGADLMFDDRVYKRGALTLHALRRTIGDEPFFDLIRSWVSTNEHGSVSTDSFVAHVREHAGAAAAKGLAPWLTGLSLPKLPAGRGRR